MLSLAPRYDLFKFQFPKDFLVPELIEKYSKVLNQRKYVITDPTEFLNESIQGIEVFGIDGSVIEQQQTHKNTNLVEHNKGLSQVRALGKIQRTEPDSQIYYRSTANPLSFLSKQITVTIRHTQGFLTYFMLMENWFHLYAKERLDDKPVTWYADIINEQGEVISRIIFKNPVFNGLDNLQLSYDKVLREGSTFNATFNYSNIDYEFIGIDPYFKDGQMNP